MSDTLFSSVVTLLGFEGANGATSTTDESLTPHTYTFHTGAQIDTSQKPFGTSSLSLNGSNGYVTAPDSADYSLGSGLFTVECHIRPTSVSGTRFICGQWLNTGDLGWILYQNGSQLALNVSTTGSDNNVQVSGGTIATNTWQHVAIDFDGTKYRAFIAGVMVASSTTLRTIFNSPDNFSIGSNSNGSSFFFAGNIKDLRITKGNNRYGSDTSFTPPSAAFPRAVTVTGVSPASGGVAGGTAVTISGTEFTNTTDVKIGGNSITSLTVVNDTTITGNTAAHAAGTVNVQVFNPSNNPTLVNGFTYSAAATVTSVSPNNGFIAGGTSVTITGTGFTGSTGVTFGGNSATSVVVVNSTTITCDTPAHAAGAVNVVVQNPTGDGTLVNGFTYIDPSATVTSVSPNFGPSTGGTNVTIVGTNFTGSTDVQFDGVSATSITVVDSTHITCTTPAGSLGTADVEVFNPNGNGTLVAGFTYVDLEARVTQAAAIVLDRSSQPVHVTQAPLLVLYKPLEGNRVTQAAAVVLFTPKPVPLPLPIVPEIPVLESWNWLSTITEGIDSKEQRFRLRETPRYKQQFNALILNEDDRVKVYNLFMRYLKTPFSYPLYQYNVNLTSAAIAGSTKLYCDTTKTDLRDNEVIALFDPQLEATTLIQATTIDADGVNLANPIENDIPASWQICPVFAFRIQPLVGMNMKNIAGSFSLVMESLYARVFQRPGAAPTFTTIDGILIIPERNLANDDINENFDFGATWYDNNIGVPGILPHWTNPHAIGTRVYSFDRHSAKMDYWRGVFDQLKGRQGKFLLPTFRNDLPLREDIALNVTEFTTFNIDFFLWYLERNYHYLQIQNANGIKYIRINGVEPHYDVNGNPDYLTVKLASSIGNVAGDNVISSISYMNLCRLDSDEVRLTHYALDTEITFDFKAIEL